MCVIEEQRPDWQELIIHESSPVQRGASLRLASSCPDYFASQYYPDVPLGFETKGVRNENLEKLSFEDESIDLHITQDVFEHILRPRDAFREIARTLRPGGAHIFTVPLVNKDTPTTPRVQIDQSEMVIHLLPQIFHDNPISQNGSLVTYDWGFDICDFIFEVSGLETEIVRLDNLDLGIRAEYIEVLVTRKPDAEAISVSTRS